MTDFGLVSRPRRQSRASTICQVGLCAIAASMTFPGESLAVYIVASNFSDISSTDKWQKEQIEITRFFPSTQAGTQVHAPFGDLVPSGETGNLIFQDWGYDRAPVNNYISWKTNEEIYLTGFNIFLTDDS
ncbi:hypothetical protein, partial [Phenylobacterium sp.]|uniref:hypothetical protein n=1 Tax=Phenylobacterium sp. TaxID=1871053 RepID=UPI0037C8815A